MKVKVFCIGFHKTGTTSMRVALTKLGYRVTGPNGVRDKDISLNVYSMADSLVAEYDAFQDNPWPIIYRYIYKNLPNSKFILTVRSTESWIKSIVRHFGIDETPMRRWIYGVGCPEGNEEIYKNRFEKHYIDVIDFFSNKPDSMLEFDLAKGDGWAKLCPFLGVETTNTLFPHANIASEREKVNSYSAKLINRANKFIKRIGTRYT